MSTRARVFISCGQHTHEERRIAGDLRDRLQGLGFDPYVAVEEQSLRGVKENIFRQLDRSEYMVFVDFRRERIGQDDKSDSCFRGSLFSHQELALAAFREIDVMVLREHGVELNGISRYIQENAKEFSDRTEIAAIVHGEIKRRCWSSSWRNELSLTDELPTKSDTNQVVRYPIDNTFVCGARYWHIPVTNRHCRKTAVNCYAYLEVIKNCRTGEETHPPTIEIKWEGYVFPNALILPHSSRKFDAFYSRRDAIVRGPAPLLRVNTLTDATTHTPTINTPADYELTFCVVSENFPPTSATFRAHVPEDPFDTHIELLPA